MIIKQILYVVIAEDMTLPELREKKNPACSDPQKQ